MKSWIIAAIVIGMLIIASIVIVNFVKANAVSEAKTIASCTSCNNKCTTSSNCGLSACDAVNGGSCSCGK